MFILNVSGFKMNIKDYKDNIIVEVKGHTYGTYKTYKLEPKTKGAQRVTLLHSSTVGEIDWNFAFIRTYRLVDIKVKK